MQCCAATGRSSTHCSRRIVVAFSIRRVTRYSPNFLARWKRYAARPRFRLRCERATSIFLLNGACGSASVSTSATSSCRATISWATASTSRRASRRSRSPAVSAFPAAYTTRSRTSSRCRSSSLAKRTSRISPSRSARSRSAMTDRYPRPARGGAGCARDRSSRRSWG